MSETQWFASVLLVAALGLFAWGKWRHDVVALVVLVVAVAGGLVSPEAAFLGFGHPAVVTVAAVLVFSRALETTGVVGTIARLLSSDQSSVGRQVAVLSAAAALLSGFVNNVGALAMLMPIAIATARRHGFSPSALLMPLSFATMLGGMTTLIGTPPNIIVSTYRAEITGTGYGLFAFFPVGAAVAVLGLAFLATIGWRLIPRGRAPLETFEGVDQYIGELHVSGESDLIGRTAAELTERLEQREVALLGFVRNGAWAAGTASWMSVAADDVLLVEGAPEALARLQGWAGVSLGAPPKPEDKKSASDTTLAEVVLRPSSPPIESTPEELRLRQRYRVNVLGVSREGARHFGGLKEFRFHAGDVLLLQGKAADIGDAVAAFEALPLGDRRLVIHDRRASLIAVGAFLAALGAIATRIAPPAIALTAGVAALLVTRVVRTRNLYQSLDGAVIVVLGALLPVGESLRTTGVTHVIGDGLLWLAAGSSAYVSLALILVITMFLSDVINNAATAVVMAPIAVGVAAGLGVSSEPFLMAVAIGASCAFLTPIGHQNNLLVMGPGGYRFGDYWRVGLPLEAIVAGVATLLLPMVWPF